MYSPAMAALCSAPDSGNFTGRFRDAGARRPDVDERQEDSSFEAARKIWRDNLAQGYCTQEEFDRQMRNLEGP